MRPIATDMITSVICASVCLCFVHTDVLCRNTAKPIEMPFREATQMSPRNHELDGVEISLLEAAIWGFSHPLKSLGTSAAVYAAKRSFSRQ